MFDPSSLRLSSLEGKIAIVTGSTQGLGEAIAHLFADRGAAGLVITGRNEANGARVKAALEATGVRTVFVAADLANMDDTRKIVAEADKAFGRVDVLVNSAGITDRGTIWDTTPDLFDTMFSVNVRAPFFLMQDALKVMKREGTQGSVVNIISMSGHGGQSFITAYSASKGALITLTKNVAFSVLNHRIRVNGLTIGHMDTPGEDRIMKTYHDAEEGWLEDAAKTKPFGRLLKPDEVARAVAFLSSGESGMMTGSIVDFDQQVLGAGDVPAAPPRFESLPLPLEGRFQNSPRKADGRVGLPRTAARGLFRPAPASLRRHPPLTGVEFRKPTPPSTPATATASVIASAIVAAIDRKPSKSASLTSSSKSAGAASGENTESVIATIFAPVAFAAAVRATVSLA